MSKQSKFLLAIPFVVLVIAMQEALGFGTIKPPLLLCLATFIATTRQLPTTIIWCAVLGALVDILAELPLLCNTGFFACVGTIANRLSVLTPKRASLLCVLVCLITAPLQRLWVALWLLDGSAVGAPRTLLITSLLGGACGWFLFRVAQGLFGRAKKQGLGLADREVS